MALSTKQLLILNTLMYMSEAPFPQVLEHQGRTVADLIAAVDPREIDPAAEYDCMISGGEWLKLLQTIRLEPTLLSLRIAATHIDRGEGGGGGRSAVFLSPSTDDAVVVFKGTQSPEEWADNFAGFNLADTPQQRNALNWYRRVYTQLGLERYRVTVTGHSKGGNKAKYIGVLEDTVQQCVAFDGQGFSELFIQKYASRIAHRQRLIESHSAEYDFVNFLFNNVGSAFFYTASPLEGAGFGRNHSPCAMMHFTPSGGFQMIPAPGGQAEGIRAVSRFSDSFFRSLSPEQRDSSYHTVEALRSAAFSMAPGEKKDLINVFLPLVSDPAHTDDLAYLLAYTIKYTQCDSTFIPQLRALLTTFGLEDITRYILLVDGILNLNIPTPIGQLTFESIMDELSYGSKSLSPGLLALLLFWVSQKGIHMTPYQLQELLGILPQVNDYLATIRPEVCASSQPTASADGLGLDRLSQSLEFLGTMMGGSPLGSPQTPPTKLRRAGSRLRAIGQVAGQISSVMQQLEPTVTDDTIDV